MVLITSQSEQLQNINHDDERAVGIPDLTAMLENAFRSFLRLEAVALNERLKRKWPKRPPGKTSGSMRSIEK